MEILMETFISLINQLAHKIIESGEAVVGLIAVSFALYTYTSESRKKLAEEKNQSLDKFLENHLRLRESWWSNWSRITTLSGNNKDIFSKEISKITQDEAIEGVYRTLEILSDVHFYYQTKGLDINESEWRKNFIFIFRPKMVAFMTAYRKYKAQGQFSKSFVVYVDSIIAENKSKNQNPPNQ